MKKISLLISLTIFFPLIGDAASCSIENGPPKELSEYMKSFDELTREIAGLKNNCQPPFKSETEQLSKIKKNLIEFYDEAEIQSDLSSAFTTDFQYTIGVAFEGNTRMTVVNQWNTLMSLEKKIDAALASLSRSCNLDAPLPSVGNRSARLVLRERLIYHRNVVAYYKSVVTGNITLPKWISETDTLFQSIAGNYNPTATESCTNEYKWADIIKKLQESVSSIGKNTGNALEWWKDAIAIFRGQGSVQKYQELQKKLLTRELARQWLSTTAQSIMVKNLECFQKATNTESSVEDIAKAKMKCSGFEIQGAENFLKGINKDYAKAKTTDQYLKWVLTADREKSTNVDNVYGIWNTINLNLLTVDETALNEQMLSDLVSIHVQLVTLNKFLKQKIPEMQKNCMKQNPGIVGACR